MARRDLCLQRAQQAIDSIGLGFDINQDISFDNFKRGPRLIQLNEQDCRDVNIPGGGISIPNVANSIKCLGGESFRIQSEVLPYTEMSEHFNVGMRLTGNIPSGHFCASFGLSGQRNKDIATTKSLAYDGWFIRRYAFELERYDGDLQDHVKEAVPSSWDPEALARFIERFGTHVVVGVSMGGKDVLYIRQEDPSYVQATSLLEFLKDKASMRFTDSAEYHSLPSEVLCNNKENIVVIYNRKGGSNEVVRHSEWLETIDSKPDVVSVFLLPLPVLLRRTRGNGIVGRAINLYVRCNPPIEDLRQFLQFQLPRRWAPDHSEKSLGFRRKKNQAKSGLKLGILGPMLYIDTIPVDVGNRPVTGLRLQLEGARSNRLAIHLQHLTSLPMGYALSDNANAYLSCDPYSCNFHQKVKRYGFSYVCTAPVESDDSVSIVTGAQLHVERNCLLLRLCFSKVVGATLKKSPEWDQSSGLKHLNSGFGCMSECKCIFPFNTIKGRQNHPKPGEVTIGSTPSASLPIPVHTPKLQKFVDTSEMVREPQDTPGYWVVSGAVLSVQNGKIDLSVKYSLLSFVN